MTIDSELRKVWRKDLAAINESIKEMATRLDAIDLEIGIHHPKITLPNEVAPAQE